MTPRTFNLLWFIIPLLVACASPKPPPSLKGDLVTGLRLNKALTIPPRSATIRFQQGAQTSSVDRFDSFCEFEVDRVSEHPQTVSAGRFNISAVDYRVVADSVTKIPLIMARDRGCDDPIYPETRFRLQSAIQPEVRSLTCANVCIHCRTGCYYLWPEEILTIVGPTFSWEVAKNDDRGPQIRPSGLGQAGQTEP